MDGWGCLYLCEQPHLQTTDDQINYMHSWLSGSVTLFFVQHNFSPSWNTVTAAKCVAESVSIQLQLPVFILGDFNQSIIINQSTLCLVFMSMLKECWYKPGTRNDTALNKWIAHRAKTPPPPSNSDHSTLNVVPTYKTVFKSTARPKTRLWQRAEDSVKRHYTLQQETHFTEEA